MEGAPKDTLAPGLQVMLGPGVAQEGATGTILSHDAATGLKPSRSAAAPTVSFGKGGAAAAAAASPLKALTAMRGTSPKKKAKAFV